MSESNVIVSQQSAEAQAALIARAELGTDPQPAAAPAAANLIFGKYKTIEDAEKGYKELEKKFHGANQAPAPAPASSPAPAPTPAAAQTPAPAPAPAPAADALTIEKAAEAENVLKKAGIDFDALSQSFASNGDLTADDRAKLAAAGFPAPVVDAYIAGIKAQAQSVIGEAHTAVGGKETFDKMRQWAAANLNDAELKAYNSAATAGGEQYKLALAGLNAKYRAAVGTEPNLLGGGSVAHGAVDVFANFAELRQAQADPRYGKDREYTKSVEAKAMRSPNI